jgi:hypothetical protein
MAQIDFLVYRLFSFNPVMEKVMLEIGILDLKMLSL